MLSKRVKDVLNAQINAEIWSAHFYLSMSLYFGGEGYRGFSRWMKKQYREDMTHAMQMMDYMIEQGDRVILQDITGIPTVFEDIVTTFEQALVHLVRITDAIDTLADVVEGENDKASRIFLDKYILGQVLAEARMNQILTQLKRMNQEIGVYMLDKELYEVCEIKG